LASAKIDPRPDAMMGGALFHVQHISRVLLGGPYIDTASYRARTCGRHEIFVRSIPMDGAAPIATARKSFKVTSDPVASIDDLIRYVNSPAYPRRFRNPILAHLNNARRSFTKGHTLVGAIQMQVLFKLVDNGAFFLPSDVRKALTDQMEDLLGCL